MGYLTHLLILSAGLLAVSGSPMGGKPVGQRRFMLTTKDKQGNARRRQQLRSGNDYSVTEGEDYFLDGLVGPAIEGAMPTIIAAFEKALPGLIQRNLPVVLKEGMPIVLEHLEEELPTILDRAMPALVEHVVPRLAEAMPQILEGLGLLGGNQGRWYRTEIKRVNKNNHLPS